MVYKALYRTYRPQKFSEVVGQEHIVRTLQNSIENNKTSHAYLFSGPRGTGKTSVARIFAKALNCAAPKNMEPCGECTSCKEIAEGMSPDVVEIDAASNNGVDEIREIREKVKFLPGGAKYKIYIIDEVHMLSQGAFNALLKTLEEPPKHVIFILATTEPHKVIPTILSRCQRFDFKTLTVQEIADLIKTVSLKEGFKISDEAIISIAESAEGGMRDALSFLDQAASFTDDEITIDDVNSVTGNLSLDKIVELAKYFEEKNINKALKTINELVIIGKEITKITASLLQFYRDCLLYKNIDTTMFSKYIFEKEEFKQIASKINTEKVFYYIDVLSDVQSKIKTASTPGIYLEVAAIKMINSSDEDFSYYEKIKELEERIENLNFSPTGEEGSVNNEKLVILENRLNKVINELSRLELHKLREMVEGLSGQTVISQTNSEDYSKLEARINELSLSFKEFKENLNLESRPTSTSITPSGEYDEKIEKIKTIILGMQSDIYELKNTKTETPKIDISQNSDLLNKLKSLESEVEALKLNINQGTDSNIKYDFEIIKDKLNNLESRVYKLMSGELEKIETKKPKVKLKGKQIGLFGDEIVNLNDFKKPVKQEDNSLDAKKIEEDDLGTVAEERVEELIPEAETKEVPVQDEITEDDATQATKETKDTEEKVVRTIKTENEEIIESEHSQLVRRLNPDIPPAIDEVQESLNLDMHLSKGATESEERQEFNTRTHDYVPPIEMADDEYSRYDVKVLERILHDSRTEDARTDKARIINLWKNLDRSVPKSQLHIATLLQDGKVVASGNKEFVLVYPSSALCNQVMRMSFKRESLKLLYDFLGDTYNYFAIPENIWLEKRTEYINQYNIGIRFPKLTPINDNTLNVLEDNKEYLKKEESSTSKAIAFFGEDLVKVE